MKSFKQGLTVTMYKTTAGKCKQGREKSTSILKAMDIKTGTFIQRNTIGLEDFACGFDDRLTSKGRYWIIHL